MKKMTKTNREKLLKMADGVAVSVPIQCGDKEIVIEFGAPYEVAELAALAQAIAEDVMDIEYTPEKIDVAVAYNVMKLSNFASDDESEMSVTQMYQIYSCFDIENKLMENGAYRNMIYFLRDNIEQRIDYIMGYEKRYLESQLIQIFEGIESALSDIDLDKLDLVKKG